jgi:hypothetical protein
MMEIFYYINNGVKLLYYSEEKIDFPYEVSVSIEELLNKIKSYD